MQAPEGGLWAAVAAGLVAVLAALTARLGSGDDDDGPTDC